MFKLVLVGLFLIALGGFSIKNNLTNPNGQQGLRQKTTKFASLFVPFILVILGAVLIYSGIFQPSTN